MGLSAADFKHHVERFAALHLEAYLSRVEAGKSRFVGQKELNDAVWHTIVLAPFEVFVLDTPLFQRLRAIRQLGVAHWTYPSAVHTRFEHVLGTVHLVQRLVDSINRRQGDSTGKSGGGVPDEWLNLLRLAALCHDIGHGFMSHVSEYSLKALGKTDKLLMDLGADLGIPRCQLSEAASAYIVTSPTFRRLLALARNRYRKHHLPDGDVADLVRSTLVGRNVRDRYPLLQQLISGPFDVDKLDYMTRDAHATGVPEVIDVPRLVEKVVIAEIATKDLPKDISSGINEAHPSHYINAVAFSGARTLDELLLGRALLFDKVYRHQKVRAAEAMVACALSDLVPLFDDKVAVIPLLFTDEEFLAFERPTIEKALGSALSNEQWAGLASAKEVVDLLRERRMFVRAYAFSLTMPRDPFEHDQAQKVGLERACREIETPPGRQQLRALLLQETRRVLDILKNGGASDAPNLDREHWLALDPPEQRSPASAIAAAYLHVAEGGERKLVHYSDDFAEATPWSDAYAAAREIGYVFSRQEIAEVAFLASEVVFREHYGVRTPASAQYYAKVNDAKIEELRSRLTSQGYYSGKPADLRARAARLKKADIRGRVEGVVANLALFEGIVRSGSRNEYVQVDAGRVLTWLAQFQTDDEVSAALSMLEGIRVIDRREVENATIGLIQEAPQFKGAYACPTGSPHDSSWLIQYYVTDLEDEYGLRVCPLAEALVEEERPIVFVDDFVGTGKQMHSVLMNWFGERDENCLKEDHGPPLLPAQREVLKSRELGLVFCAGSSEGARRVEATAAHLGLQAKVHVAIDAATLPRAFDEKSVEYEACVDKTRWQRRCAAIGKHLLRTRPEDPCDDETAEGRALGYGNGGLLLAFPYNVPSATLTLLWSSGKTTEGWDWLPLLPRRRKPRGRLRIQH